MQGAGGSGLMSYKKLFLVIAKGFLQFNLLLPLSFLMSCKKLKSMNAFLQGQGKNVY